MKDDDRKRESRDVGGNPSSRPGIAINVRDALSFIPEEKSDGPNEWARHWTLELEGRYRADGAPLSKVDLNYRQTRVNLRWVDAMRCILACRTTSDGVGRTDLYLAGPRAILAVHRYIGRIKKLGDSEISKRIAVLVGLYCADGGPQKNQDTTPLMKAAATGDEARVAEFLKSGTDVNVEDMIANTAASYAARFAKPRIFQVLVTADARVDNNFEGRTLLHDAASGGDVSIISHLLRAGLDINAVDWGGRTPIWESISEGNAEAAEYLLAEGADPTMRSAAVAFPRMGWGLNLLIRKAVATLGRNHQLTQMLGKIEKEGKESSDRERS